MRRIMSQDVKYSGVTSPKFCGGQIFLTLNEQQYFVWDGHRLLKHKTTRILEIWRGHDPLVPQLRLCVESIQLVLKRLGTDNLGLLLPYLLLNQGSPNYGPRAKTDPRSHFIRQQRHFVNNEKITYLRKYC